MNNRFEKFIKPNNPLLNETAKEVEVSEIKSKEIQDLIDEMIHLAKGEQGEKKTLVGLAAPQIGISKRIILIDVMADGKGKTGDLRVYINPEILWKSKEENEWYEGCFSTAQVCGIVSRPTSVKIKAYNRDGILVEEEHTGYIARIFQHEIDHLNGNVFVSHIEDDSDLHWVEVDEFPIYRNQEAWKAWPKKCSREEWKKMKGIRS